MAFWGSCLIITVQMMKQFLNDRQVMWLSFPNQFQPEFNGLLNSDRQVRGTLSCQFEPNLTNVTDFSITSSTCSILLPGSYTRSLLSSTDTDLVQKMYAELYSMTHCTDLEVHSAYCRYMTVTINDQVYGSYKSRAKSSSIILAKLSNEIRPARINYFAKHNARGSPQPIS